MFQDDGKRFKLDSAHGFTLHLRVRLALGRPPEGGRQAQLNHSGLISS